jgi:uncharacterized OsmC-like protein
VTTTQSIREAMQGAINYLTENPAEARATDSYATATIEEGLRCTVRGPDGAETHTDMVTSIGGENSAPSPGWLLRAATASCVATLIAMRAAHQGVNVQMIEVTVDSESDDRGILGISGGVPAGPLSVSTRIKVGPGSADHEVVREIIEWGDQHCPVSDLTRRAVPMNMEITIV